MFSVRYFFYTNRECIPLHGFGVVLLIGLIIISSHAELKGRFVGARLQAIRI
jgi:hypothetical protein